MPGDVEPERVDRDGGRDTARRRGPARLRPGLRMRDDDELPVPGHEQVARRRTAPRRGSMALGVAAAELDLQVPLPTGIGSRPTSGRPTRTRRSSLASGLSPSSRSAIDSRTAGVPARGGRRSARLPPPERGA